MNAYCVKGTPGASDQTYKCIQSGDVNNRIRRWKPQGDVKPGACNKTMLEGTR